MKIPESLLQYIREESARIHHGRIIIELNATSDKVYVVTEVREQFKAEPPEHRYGGPQQTP